MTDAQRKVNEIIQHMKYNGFLDAAATAKASKKFSQVIHRNKEKLLADWRKYTTERLK